MSRTVRIEKRKRGFFGKLMKLAFILFNLFMVYAVLSGIVSVSQEAPSRMSDIEKAGYGAGTALGFGFLIFVWAAGDIILGLFVLLTRGSKVITEEVVS